MLRQVIQMLSKSNFSSVTSLLESIEKAAPNPQNLKLLMKSALQDPYVNNFLQEHHIKPDSQVVKRSQAEIFNFVREKKKSSVAGYQPELIISGAINQPGAIPSINISYRATEETLANRAADAAKKRFQLVASNEQTRTACFAKVKPEIGKTAALQAACLFVKHYSKQNPGKGFYLYGDLGTGKTYLVASLIRELAVRGVNCLFVYLPNFVGNLYKYLDQKELPRKIDQISSVDVLVLDDIGAEKLSSWNRDQVLSVILENRMEANLPTFFTSNLNLSSLEKHLAITKDGTDYLKAKRILERIRFLARPIKLTGINYRHQVK